MFKAKDPSQQMLRLLFDYDAERGVLIWRFRARGDFQTNQPFKRWNSIFPGKDAGWKRADGYRAVKINGREHLTHRLIWIWHNGDIPDGLEIDHEDRNRGNSKVSNLSPATRSQNQKNASMRKDNASGVRGIHWHKVAGKWCVQIYSDKKCAVREYFSELSDAISCVNENRIKFNFSKSHGA